MERTQSIHWFLCFVLFFFLCCSHQFSLFALSVRRVCAMCAYPRLYVRNFHWENYIRQQCFESKVFLFEFPHFVWCFCCCCCCCYFRNFCAICGQVQYLPCEVCRSMRRRFAPKFIDFIVQFTKNWFVLSPHTFMYTTSFTLAKQPPMMNVRFEPELRVAKTVFMGEP